MKSLSSHCVPVFLFTNQLKCQCRQRRTHGVQRHRLSRLDVSFSWSIFHPVAQVTWQKINQHHWVHYGQSVGWLWHHIQALGLRSLKWKNIFWITLSLYCYTEPVYNGSTKWSAAFLNRPFPSSLAPLFQNESKCETILMKMTLICMKKKLRVELIFIWKVSHLDSLWNRGTRVGNGLLVSTDFMWFSAFIDHQLLCYVIHNTRQCNCPYRYDMLAFSAIKLTLSLHLQEGTN